MPPASPIKCRHCGRTCGNPQGRSAHERWCAKNPAPAVTRADDAGARKRENQRRWRERRAAEAAAAVNGTAVVAEVVDALPARRKRNGLDHEADLLAMVALAFPRGIPTADQFALAGNLRWITDTHRILTER